MQIKSISGRRASLLYAAVVLFAAPYLSAAPVVPPTLVVSLRYVNAFSTSFPNSTAPAQSGISSSSPLYYQMQHSGPYRYQFDVYVQLIDQRPITQAVLQAFSFNIQLNASNGAVLTPNTATSGSNIPYNGNNAVYRTDTSDIGSQAPVFFANKDGGTPFDMQSILVALNDSGTAFDRHVGEGPRPDPAWTLAGEGDDGLGYPSKVGTINFIWNGQGDISVVPTPINGTFLAEYLADGSSENETNAIFQGIGAYSWPEPALTSFVALGGTALLRAPRRIFRPGTSA